MEIGRITMIGIGKEAGYGDKAAAITYFPVESFDPAPRTESIREEGMFGRKENNLAGTCVAQTWAEPSFEGIVYDQVFGHLVMAALGTTNKTGTVSPVTHDFTVNNAGIPSYTIIWKDGVVTRMITGAVLNTLDITQEAGGHLTYSTSFIGRSPVTTTETPGITAENKFCGKFATLKLDPTVAGLGAATAIDAESFNLSINKNAEAKYVFGAINPTLVHDKQIEVTGDFTLEFAADTYMELNKTAGVRAMLFTAKNTDVTLGIDPSDDNPTVQFELASTTIDEWTRNGGKDDRLTQTCGFVASYSLTDTSMIKAKLVNARTTVY